MKCSPYPDERKICPRNHFFFFSSWNGLTYGESPVTVGITPCQWNSVISPFMVPLLKTYGELTYHVIHNRERVSYILCS